MEEFPIIEHDPNLTAEQKAEMFRLLREQICGTFKEERDRNREEGEMITLTLETRVPSKYRVVDLETGDVWKWEEGKWVRAALATVKLVQE